MPTSMEYRIQRYTQALSLGFLPYLVYVLQGMRNKIIGTSKPYTLLSNACQFPLKCRAKTSDLNVFHQIFVDREYRCLDDILDAALIIDCGANVGYSSAYFLSRFKNAHVISIEPDPENFKLLKENVKSFGTRCNAICSAVWSHPTGLRLSEETFGDGKEWSRTVREVRSGETPDMTAVDIGSLLDKSYYERISILKVDIEGAESTVFSANFEHWLEKVDNLVIELHGMECEDVVRKAIDGKGFSVSTCDELLVCKRIL